jgi:hypothetical protein
VTEAAVRAAFAEQAGWCERLVSPFTASLCRLLGERLDRSTAIGRKALDWSGNPSPLADALALRLCGGLQALARSGRYPGLAACYPPHPLPAPERLWTALRPTLDDPGLPAWLDRPPQTNEVGRAAALMGGLLVIADCFARPMVLLELGASAGLNLLMDHFGYDLGGLRAGDADSSLQLRPDWTGPPPPDSLVDIVGRAGVDIAPLDPRRDGERLLAYVWPDQAQRQAQLAAALAIAAIHGVAVDRGDAADWLDRKLAEPAPAGITRVVYHSVAIHYFPAGSQSRIATRLAELGAHASPESPLAWLRYEQEPGEPHFSLRLRVWPGDEEWRLAECHPHGRWIGWL